jgi:hypothetical protein
MHEKAKAACITRYAARVAQGLPPMRSDSDGARISLGNGDRVRSGGRVGGPRTVCGLRGRGSNALRPTVYCSFLIEEESWR